MNSDKQAAMTGDSVFAKREGRRWEKGNHAIRQS